MSKEHWSTEASKALDEERASKPREEVFTVKGLHPTMNPHGVRRRESRMSELSPHPRSLILAIDGSGSHDDWPMRMTTGSLTNLMTLMHDHGFLQYPQVLISMIRDTLDTVPLEVGQFEVDQKIREDLEHCYVAAGGGSGPNHLCEAYELIMWWAATHTSCDSFEVEGRKGYLVICGDEMSNPVLESSTIRRVTGETLEATLSFETILDMAQRQWEVVFFYSHTDYYTAPEQRRVFEWWKQRFGERAIHLYSPDDLAAQTAMVTGLIDGSVANLEEGLTRLASVGTSTAVIDRVRRAVAPFATSLGKVSAVEGVETKPDKRRAARV